MCLHSEAMNTSNITDVDEGDTVSITGSVNVDRGSITENQDGSYNFIPEPNYNGNVTFSFRASDGNGGTVMPHKLF